MYKASISEILCDIGFGKRMFTRAHKIHKVQRSPCWHRKVLKMEKTYCLIGAVYKENFKDWNGMELTRVHCSKDLSTILREMRRIYYTCVGAKGITKLYTNTVHQGKHDELSGTPYTEEEILDNWKNQKPCISYTQKRGKQIYSAEFIVLSNEDFIELKCF